MLPLAPFALLRLQKHERTARRKLELLQLRKLRSVVASAYHNVPYYFNLFSQRGLGAPYVATLDDIKKIPITTRQDLQAAREEDLVNRSIPVRETVRLQTSGATGVPLCFRVTHRQERLSTLLNLRILFAHDFRLRHKVAVIMDPRLFPEKPYWFQKLGVLRRFYISASEDASRQLHAISEIDPEVVYGFASSLLLISDEILRTGPAIRPRMVFSTGEKITPVARQRIEQAFGARVADVYGTEEMADVAWQCERFQSLHVSEDHVIVELVDDRGQPVPEGQPGFAVMTNLDAYATPFIRYRVGDICVADSSPCPCGRTFRCLKDVEGRENDMVVFPSGRRESAFAFVHVMELFPEARAYRVIQENPGRIDIYLIPQASFTEETARGIVREAQKRLIEPIEICVRPVKELPKDASGKIRSFISKV